MNDDFELSTYVTKIRNLRVNLLYALVHIDLHCLATCKTKNRSD